MSPIIEVSHLTKKFKEIKAVDDLSFTVSGGQVYGFLGQNGAGKSTTIRMLLTLIKQDEGEIKIFGLDLRKKRREILRRVGAIIERPDMYKYLTALENLRICCAMSGIRLAEKKLMEQLEQVGLHERAHSKVKTFSQGMKQRLGIATALIHDPDLVILDEPLNGLDPQGIAEMRSLILQLSREMSKTLLISSHLLGEMEQVADSMIIIDKGKKVVEGRVRDLFDPAQTIVQMKTSDDIRAMEKMEQSHLKTMLQGIKNDCIVLQLNREDIPGVLRDIIRLDISVISFYSRHSLEDYFLSLTGYPHGSAVAH